MAALQHDTLTHSQVHEPKWIGLNGISDTGKVITSSSSTPGISEYRNLKLSEITEVNDFVTIWQPDGTSAAALLWPAPYAGLIVNWALIQEKALTTADNVYELQINGVQVGGTPVTVLEATGVAGDIYTGTAIADFTFSQADVISVIATTVGNTDATAAVRAVIQVQRT